MSAFDVFVFVTGIAMIIMGYWAYIRPIPDKVYGFASVFMGVVMMITSLGTAYAKRERASLQEFIMACAHDHKPYECVALWRGGAPFPERKP